jgi:hypothetical protein
LELPCVDNINPHTVMPFGEYPSVFGPPIQGDYPSVFGPPIQGEYTRLLFEVHGDGTALPAARQLDFGEGASTSRFQQ